MEILMIVANTDNESVYLKSLHILIQIICIFIYIYIYICK